VPERKESALKHVWLVGLLLIGLAGQARADDYVRGYLRSNGTYVSGHYRSSPDSTVTNNYSFYGNSNPYTGSIGRNHYYDAPSSPYYSGSSSSTFGSYSSYGSRSSGFDAGSGSSYHPYSSHYSLFGGRGY
jgi:hypothetical protein